MGEMLFLYSWNAFDIGMENEVHPCFLSASLRLFLPSQTICWLLFGWVFIFYGGRSE